MSKRPADVLNSAPKKLKPSSITSFFSVDAAASSSPKTTSSKPGGSPFDRTAWIAGLSATHKELLALEVETLHESWLDALHGELTKPYFLKLKEFLKEERQSKTVYPPDRDIYAWSRHTPLDSVKVVILGQDPYHNVNQAHGLCFSVQAPTPAPPSLKNIYRALKNDFPTGFREPKHGSLLAWADRGVLLLNACLTVRAHEANSHASKGWEQFTGKVIEVVAARRSQGVVFMAWGKPASKRVEKVDGRRHLKLEAVHPSPLSAHKGFFDCGHFKRANEWLSERYGSGVDWDCLADVQSKEGTSEKRSVPIEGPPKLADKALVQRDQNEQESFDEEALGISEEEERLLAEAADALVPPTKELDRKPDMDTDLANHVGYNANGEAK